MRFRRHLITRKTFFGFLIGSNSGMNATLLCCRAVFISALHREISAPAARAILLAVLASIVPSRSPFIALQRLCCNSPMCESLHHKRWENVNVILDLNHAIKRQGLNDKRHVMC